jgi:hypothetical protein
VECVVEVVSVCDLPSVLSLVVELPLDGVAVLPLPVLPEEVEPPADVLLLVESDPLLSVPSVVVSLVVFFTTTVRLSLTYCWCRSSRCCWEMVARVSSRVDLEVGLLP